MKIENIEEDRKIKLSVRGDDRQIKANLSDLMANSKYFASRLAGHLSPESSHLSDSVIFDPDEIPTYHVLKQLVQFLSSETNTNAAVLAESHVEQLIYAADFLQIDSVLRLLLAHLRIRMPNNCHPEDMDRRQVMLFLRLLNVLTRHWHLHSVEWDSTGTMICCEKHEKLTGPMTYEKTPQFYICYHFKSVMYEHALVTLTYRSIYALLLSDDLRISEEDVVRTIKMWINFDYKARIQHYSFLLKCVRFDPEMKLEFILEEILSYSDTARDYVISLLALRNGYQRDIAKSGPVISHQRNFHNCEEYSEEY